MKVRLLFPDRNAQWLPELSRDCQDLFADCKAEPLLQAMSGGDPEIRQVCAQLLGQPLQEQDAILYRQEILQECLQKPQVIRKLHDICLEAEEQRKNTWTRLTSPHLSTVYSSAADLLKIYMEALVEIRKVLEAQDFASRGLKQLADLLKQELSEEYLQQVRSLQCGIGEQDGILISARLGAYLQGVGYVKRQPRKGLSRLRWMLQPSYTLADRDMNGAKDLEVRRDRAINEVANAMAQAADSLQSFVDQLRLELSFYLGAMGLWEALKDRDLCYPLIGPAGERRYRELYDGSLALTSREPVVGNSLELKNKGLVLITGANQGGKTTFLRSVGLCQLMAQCGLFVCAQACQVPVNGQIFTHFGREEDRTLSSGKLDEELGRMSDLITRIRPGDLLLSNESFSSTNDRDGSEIFVGITRALLEQGISVFAVTHLMDYAQAMAQRPDAWSLRAQRGDRGERTFRLTECPPRPEAYAEDIYQKVFGNP